jgi:hypothetical protein
MIIVEPDAAWRARIEKSLTKSPKRYMFDTARAAITYFRGKDGINIPLVLVVANRYLPTPELDNLDDPDMAALVRKFDRSRQVIWLIDEPAAHIPDDLRVLTKPFAAADLENLAKEIHIELHSRVKVDPPNTPILLIEPDEETHKYILLALSEFDITTADLTLAVSLLDEKSFRLVIAANHRELDLSSPNAYLDSGNTDLLRRCNEKWISTLFLYSQGMHLNINWEPLYNLIGQIWKPFDRDELKLYINNLLLENLIIERDRKLYRWDEVW